MNRLELGKTMHPPELSAWTTTVTYDANGNVISVSESDGPVMTKRTQRLRHCVFQQTGDGRRRDGHHNLLL